YEAGRARAIGVSNWSVEDLERTVARGSIVPHVNQVQFSPFQFRRALLDECRRLGVLFESYSPLARGRGVRDATVQRSADELGRTPAQVMLRWALERDVPVIPKSVRRERIVENAAVFDFSLPPEAMAALDALDETGGSAQAR